LKHSGNYSALEILTYGPNVPRQLIEPIKPKPKNEPIPSTESDFSVQHFIELSDVAKILIDKTSLGSDWKRLRDVFETDGVDWMKIINEYPHKTYLHETVGAILFDWTYSFDYLWGCTVGHFYDHLKQKGYEAVGGKLKNAL
jgi:hypothetical protein